MKKKIRRQKVKVTSRKVVWRDLLIVHQSQAGYDFGSKFEPRTPKYEVEALHTGTKDAETR